MIAEAEFLADLQEFMAEEEKKFLNINMDGNNNDFLINDKHQANYFIKLSKECENDIESVKAFVEEERNRLNTLLDSYQNDQVTSIQKRKSFYDSALESYTYRELENSSKRSIKLPFGTLSLKKQQPVFEYEDEDVIAWAQIECPEIVKTVIPEPKISIDKKELKKIGIIEDGLLYINGKEVSGIQVQIRDDKFEVK